MDTKDLTLHKEYNSDDSSCLRRSSRLNTAATASEATVVSNDVEEKLITLTPAVGADFRHSTSSTDINATSHKHIRITSSSTNISVLTQGTMPSSAALHSDSACEGSTARRSKRITSARLEYKRKQKTRLFVNPSKSSDFEAFVYQSEKLPGQTVVDSDFIPPVSINNKRAKTSETSYSIECGKPTTSIAYCITPTLFSSCQDSLTLTYLYKSVYGTDYFASLMERENTEFDKRAESVSRHSPTLFRAGARPRTRSICREEEKEMSRIVRTAPFYMSSNFQFHISLEMRSILIGWIISVAKDLKLMHETIHCCVKVLDRGLEKIEMTTETFHAYGCACLLLAVKLNEVKAAKAVDVSFFTDGACTTNEICSMEMQICMALNFDLQYVTSFHFLDHFLDASFTMSISSDNDLDAATVRYNPKLHAMALFILETSLLIPSLVDVKDSLIAAAALYLARALVGVGEVIWNDQLVHHSRYRVENLSEIVSLLHHFLQHMEGNENMRATLKRFNTADYHFVPQKVSILPSDLKLP